MNNAAASPVILDTDMGIDDWFALLYLAKSPSAELKAITIACSGETHCTTGENNAISLLSLVKTQKQIPVASGDAYPLDGYFVFPAAWRKDADTLSGVTIPPPTYKPVALPAKQLIHQQISHSIESVTIVAVGPLTNIAQWLLAYPEDVNHVSRLVIIGGTLDAKGNIIVPGFTDKHPGKSAEWNFYIDPLAARFVLDSSLHIELVGLDVTNHVKVSREYVSHFRHLAKTPEALFAEQVYIRNQWFIDSGEYYFWDVLAAIISTHSELCIPESTALTVKLDYLASPNYLASSDLSMPATRWDGKPRSHLAAATAGTIRRGSRGNKVDVCMRTNANRAFELLTNTLTK